jgi:hypothetical protein
MGLSRSESHFTDEIGSRRMIHRDALSLQPGAEIILNGAGL